MTHVMFGPADPQDSLTLYVQIDPEHPQALRDPAVAQYVESLKAVSGAKLVALCGERRWEL